MSGLVFYIPVKHYHCTNVIHSLIISSTNTEHLLLGTSQVVLVVKNSPVNAGDPGSGRSSGEGIGYPLQYSWASLVAQLVKNLGAMQETWV